MMDLSKYLEKYVKIDLSNGYFYEGLVLGYDSDFLMLRDKFGKNVTISIKSIIIIREEKDGGR